MTLWDKCWNYWTSAGIIGQVLELACRNRKLQVALARLHAPVHRLERVFDGDRGVGKDFSQDRFGASDQISSTNVAMR